MSKDRKVICNKCKEKFYKDELIQINKSKRFCSKCNEAAQKDINDYKSLIDYICTGFNIKAPTGQQLKSIKQFKELGYSYWEIQYTLYYIYCILKKKPDGTSIGLVPFYYEKAKEHYNLVQNAKRTAQKIVTEETEIERRVNNFKPNLKNTRLINIEELV